MAGVDGLDLLPALSGAGRLFLQVAHLALGAQVGEPGHPDSGLGTGQRRLRGLHPRGEVVAGLTQGSGHPHSGVGQLAAVAREDLPRRADGDGPPVGVEGQDLVDDGQYRVEVVVDDDDRRARGRQGGDEGVELLPAGGIDGAGRLVEHEELWAHGQGDGEREPLTLSARERPGVVPDALDESHRAQGLLDPRGDLRPGQAQVLQREGDIVVDGAGDDGGVGALADVGDGLGQGLDGGVGDLGAGQSQAAGVLRGQAVRDEAAQRAHEGGFAASRGADDGGDLSAQVGEVDGLQDPALASEVVDAQALDAHQCRIGRLSLRLLRPESSRCGGHCLRHGRSRGGRYRRRRG